MIQMAEWFALSFNLMYNERWYHEPGKVFNMPGCVKYI